jgi:hypothetical protein
MRHLVIWVIEVRARRNVADHSDVHICRAVKQFMSVRWSLVMTVREMFHPSMGKSVGRNSIVSVATRYELDGLRIKSRCGRDFSLLSRTS